MPRLSIVGSERDSASERVAARIAAEENRGLLRFLTCGSVDDGKSTLIGRLLYDSALVYEDQLKSAEQTSGAPVRKGSGPLDLALLIDGLEAEREQSITIDVAYRYFSTPRRKFIVADTPGHVQYTRNMATGASNCDFAVLLVDARSGVLTQTRRHACILSLLGIRKIALAVNKMDLVEFDQARFEAIAADFSSFVEPLKFDRVTSIPVSALKGDNVIHPSAHMHWYHGPTLLAHLETVDVDRGGEASAVPLSGAVGQPAASRFPRLCRDGGERCRCGPATRWRSTPPANARMWRGSSPPTAISPRRAKAMRSRSPLPRRSTSSRGDVIAPPDAAPSIADQIAARLIWFDEEPMLPGRPYTLKCGCQTTTATVSSLKYKLNVDNLDHVAGKTLELNEVGLCNLTTAKALVFDPYAENGDTGSFILIDRFTNATVAAGMIEFGLAAPPTSSGRSCSSTRPRAPGSRIRSLACFGSRGCPAPASRRSPTRWRSGCMPWAGTLTCSMATISATASTRISASPMPTASRTSAASPRRRSCSSMPG